MIYKYNTREEVIERAKEIDAKKTAIEAVVYI